MPKIALALNTTTEVLELAIARVNPIREFEHSEWKLGRELSVEIHNCLSKFMRDRVWADLAFVSIASGVGSFTSTRIGIVLARTLGEQLQIPVYALNCKELESYYQASEHTTGEGSQIMSLIEVGHDRWIKGNCPEWSEALPLYG